MQGKPDDLVAHVFLTAVYVSCNLETEAHATAAEVLRIDPRFSIEYFSRQIKHKKSEDNELFIDGPRKAGLK